MNDSEERNGTFHDKYFNITQMNQFAESVCKRLEMNTNRKFNVKETNLFMGAAQGSVLRPLHFVTYIADLTD